MVRGDSIFVFVVEYMETILLIEHSMCYWHANGSWLLLLLSLLPICLLYYGRAKQSKKNPNTRRFTYKCEPNSLI